MGLVSRLKKLKLKKMQPGKLIKGVVSVAAAAGVPGAAAAQKVVDRVGKKVDDFNRTKERVAAQMKEVAKNSGAGAIFENPVGPPMPAPGMSVEEANLAGAGPTMAAAKPSNQIMILAAIVVAVFFLKKGR